MEHPDHLYRPDAANVLILRGDYSPISLFEALIMLEARLGPVRQLVAHRILKLLSETALLRLSKVRH